MSGLRPVLVFLVLALAAPLVPAQQSVARQWNELLLESIRKDFARPTVHARNLYHVALAMYDAWAVYDLTARPLVTLEDHSGVAPTKLATKVLQQETLSFATYRLLRARFYDSPGADEMLPQYDALMASLGHDPDDKTLGGSSPAAIGNRIAITILAQGLADGANEQGGYANLVYEPVNPPLLPALPGNPNIADLNRWQPLALEFFVDQSGNMVLEGYPEFLSPEWGQVTPFALQADDMVVGQRDGFDYLVYHDPGPPPYLGTSDGDAYKWGNELVSIWSSHLDPTDGVMIDASPASIGNAVLPEGLQDYPEFYDRLVGGDASLGYEFNPVTGEPYPPQMVPRGDYGRVLAEFWADGPDSETPPGHWFVLLNDVSDHPLTEKRIGGEGSLVDDLEWDVKAYLALGGAMHDCAVAAWGAKGWYDYIRPISAIRAMADLGQSSNPALDNYHPDGIRLVPGYIENVTPGSTLPGRKHAHLAGEEGKIALYAWRGPDFIANPDTDEAGVGWILADDWWPYQRPSFVTPPFAGYVSGHSTYSRAAAVILHRLTGSPWFPGGLGEYLCPQDEFLVFEDGPSVDVRLQWASYYDASDQCSLSRIWGGIHPPADDIPGRKMGEVIGHDAFDVAEEAWTGGPLAEWKDVGGALPGVLGPPRLQGSGDLVAGAPVTFTLFRAAPLSSAFFVLGASEASLPFKGGVLVPSPDIVLTTTVPPGLAFEFSAPWPAGIPPGAAFYYQYWITDFLAPNGYSASNGLRSTTTDG